MKRKRRAAFLDQESPNYITLTDDDGTSIELEYIDTVMYKNQEYMIFLQADMDESDPDYGYIILKVVQEDGEDILIDVETEEELNEVYDYFMEELFAYEDSDDEEE
jgi:hypothetical protein